MGLPTTETLHLSLDNFVLTIKLNRPEVINAMSLQMSQELCAVFTAIEHDETIRAVILRGSNGNFCAGGDIKDMANARKVVNETGSHEAYVTLNRAFGDMLIQVNHAPQVVIALLEGAVLGGGFGLACVSDIALTLTSAKFGLPETRLGILPAQIAPFVVQRIGLTQARYLALLGSRFDGSEAVKLGIAHQAFDSSDQLETGLQQVLASVKKCAPLATRQTKALLHQVGHEPLTSLLDEAAQQFALAVSGDEGTEGTLAFVQKRPAAWAK